MRNKQRLRELADFIEGLPQGKFHMKRWAIAKDRGFAERVLGEQPSPKVIGVHEAHKLGLSSAEAYELDTEDVKKIGLEEQRNPSCNTAMCIAGWCCFFWPEEIDEREDFSYNAGRILGLEHDVAGSLFTATDLDAEGAGRELRRLADGQRLSWLDVEDDEEDEDDWLDDDDDEEEEE